MNKQRFLAELSRLLSFMTEADRQATLKKLSERFDEAGPEGEAAVIAQLGTPVQMAIRFSRGYIPSDSGSSAPIAPVQEPVQPAANGSGAQPDEGSAKEPEASEATEDADAAEDTAKTIEAAVAAAVGLDDENAGDKKPASVEKPTPDEKKSHAKKEAQNAEKHNEKSAKPAAPAPETKPAEKRELRHGGKALATLVLLTVLGGIPLLAVYLAVVLGLLGLGAAGIAAGAVSACAGFMAVSILADALMLFGAALVGLGLGVLLLWLGVWAAVMLAKLVAAGIATLYALAQGKEVAEA